MKSQLPKFNSKDKSKRWNENGKWWKFVGNCRYNLKNWLYCKIVKMSQFFHIFDNFLNTTLWYWINMQHVYHLFKYLPAHPLLLSTYMFIIFHKNFLGLKEIFSIFAQVHMIVLGHSISFSKINLIFSTL